MPIGVTYSPDRCISKPYCASVSQNGQSYRIGYFATPEEAFNTYKLAKEQVLKDVAAKYQGVIDPRAYAALMTYQVEITD